MTARILCLEASFLPSAFWTHRDYLLFGSVWPTTPMPESFQCYINKTKPSNSLSPGNISAPILQKGEKQADRHSESLCGLRHVPRYPSLHSSALNQPLNHRTRKDRHQQQAPALCKQGKKLISLGTLRAFPPEERTQSSCSGARQIKSRWASVQKLMLFPVAPQESAVEEFQHSQGCILAKCCGQDNPEVQKKACATVRTEATSPTSQFTSWPTRLSPSLMQIWRWAEKTQTPNISRRLQARPREYF